MSGKKQLKYLSKDSHNKIAEIQDMIADTRHWQVTTEYFR